MTGEHGPWTDRPTMALQLPRVQTSFQLTVTLRKEYLLINRNCSASVMIGVGFACEEIIIALVPGVLDFALNLR